ncbi:MAG: hypothetical protein BRC26_00050 [Nanohaloarchaea archaeon QH_8_44_6]|nr:MAG: hypothetical protein BRC26_00050 [Nanohaloarchaea archaeon QH_8_44_6]
MSRTRSENKLICFETREKAEEYEPMADWLLKNGQLLDSGDFETKFDAEDYQNIDAYTKFELLTNFYNQRRDIGSKKYDSQELLEQIAAIMEEPEAVKSGQEDQNRGINLEYEGKEKLEKQKYPSVENELLDESKTGSPGDSELKKVVRRLETKDPGEKIKYTGLEKA